MKKFVKHHKKIAIASGVLSLISILTILVSVSVLYLSDKIINTKIANQDIFISNKSEVASMLSQNLDLPDEINLVIKTPTDSQEFLIESSSIDAKINYEKTAEIAFQERSIKNLWQKNSVLPVIEYDEAKLNEQLSLIAGQLYVPPVYPDIVDTNGVVTVTKGQVGYEVDVNLLEKTYNSRLATLSDKPIELQMRTVGQVLGDSDEQLIKENHTKLAGKSIEFKFENYSHVVSDEELTKLISGVSGFEDSPVNLLINILAENVEREPQNPVFKEVDGRVVEFSPAKDGIEIANSRLRQSIDRSLSELVATDIDSLVVEIPVNSTEPELKTADVNDYGIKELIGRGSSKFVGSIPNRVHNVALAAERISGTLVAPGETFSFNKTVGDISAYTGFKQSYVIQGNQTVLGDGGGVCQVSTTLFRAALNTGLPIAERRAHSYRVGYYEQEAPIGLDATIYSPSVDLKITNDTPAHMLIQAYVDTTKMSLEFEIYGTSDGREVTLTDPIVTSRSAAPEDLYIDDPTKPAGYIEQIDYAAAGARVEYDYKVVRDGETLQDKKFYSNYRPWQAKFIRGTGPAQ